MNKIEKKINESSLFYKESFLNFDITLRELNYRTLKTFFKGENALELGPASGFMTKKMVEEFNHIDLVEGSKELLEEIPNYDNITKFHSIFEKFTTDKKYDTIVMAHVLEHLSDPVEVCTRVYDWLSDSGVFLVSVPNAKSIHRLVAKEMGLLKNEYELNSRDHELGHYRVYDMDLLQQHLKNAGFKILDSGGIFLKPLSNRQIEDNWTDEMIEGFYLAGKYFQEHCAEIYVVCGK